MGEPNYKRAYSHLSQSAKMHYEEQGMYKEPLQAEYILLDGIGAGDELSMTLLIEYYSDKQGPLYPPGKVKQLQ